MENEWGGKDGARGEERLWRSGRLCNLCRGTRVEMCHLSSGHFRSDALSGGVILEVGSSQEELMIPEDGSSQEEQSHPSEKYVARRSSSPVGDRRG